MRLSAERQVNTRQTMRIYSTPESEAAGEMTVLSIVETLIAMGIYVAIWWLTGSLLHLAIAAIAAPVG